MEMSFRESVVSTCDALYAICFYEAKMDYKFTHRRDGFLSGDTNGSSFEMYGFNNTTSKFGSYINFLNNRI